MKGQVEAVREALMRAQSDPAAARALLENPVTELAKLGVKVPGVSNAQVAEHFAATVPDLHRTLSAVASGAMRPEALGDEPYIDGCSACKTAMMAVAVAIVGIVTVAGGGAIAIDAPVVATVAAFFSLDLAAALALINTCIGVVTAGVGAVAQGLCVGAGICS